MAKQMEEAFEAIDKSSAIEYISKWSAVPGLAAEAVLVEALKNTSAQVERRRNVCDTPICNLFDGLYHLRVRAEQQKEVEQAELARLAAESGYSETNFVYGSTYYQSFLQLANHPLMQSAL